MKLNKKNLPICTVRFIGNKVNSIFPHFKQVYLRMRLTIKNGLKTAFLTFYSL